MRWHRIHLTNDEVADDRHGQIMDAVDRFVVQTGFPSNFDIWTEPDEIPEGGMNLYLSPELAEEMVPYLPSLNAQKIELADDVELIVFFSSGGPARGA